MKNSKIAQLVKTLSDEVKSQYVDEWFKLYNGYVDKKNLSMIYDSIQEKYIEWIFKGEDIISREYAEQSFDDFKDKYDDFEVINDICNSNKITREIDKFYNYFPNEFVSFLFEKYISYEDFDNSHKNNTLLCVKYLTNRMHDELSKDSKDNIYAMLRLAFESDNYDQEETAISIIENLRDKICLQIIIDSINNDCLDESIISYAKTVQKELEDELDFNYEDK